MQNKLNTLGLYLILLLMMLVLVHKEISKLFVYYREIFSLVFIGLFFVHRSSHIVQSFINRRVFIEIFDIALNLDGAG